MKRWLISLIILGAVTFTLTSTAPPIRAGDFDGNAACDECLQNAQTNWEVCVETEAGGDRGDADCESRRVQAIIYCQTTACID